MINLADAKLVLLADMASFTVPLFGEGTAFEATQLQLKRIGQSSLMLSSVRVEGLNIEIGEHTPPAKDVCCYDHVNIKTALETLRIEWKGWKDDPDYSCMGLDSCFDCRTYSANSPTAAIALAIAAYADRLRSCFSDAKAE